MNIDTIKTLCEASATDPLEFPGDQQINLTPLTDEDCVTFAGLDSADVLTTNCFLVSKAIAEVQGDQWVKTCDTDEGRKMLRRFSPRALRNLAHSAKRISGLLPPEVEKAPAQEASA